MDTWIRQSIIYNKNHATIYDISGGWVMKMLHDPKTEELRILKQVFNAKPRSCVFLPSEDCWGDNWYVMRRYDGQVTTDSYCRSRWRDIGVQVLQFLEDFHHDVGMAHLDIKKGNILVDKTAGTFHVCDFANADTPVADTEKKPLGWFVNNTKWYYAAMGGDLDQPFVSWRMDLVALGYLLASLLVDNPWRFEAECWDKREWLGVLSDAETITLRGKEISRVIELEAYFARLVIVAWTALEPPPRSFYQELAGLLSC